MLILLLLISILLMQFNNTDDEIYACHRDENKISDIDCNNINTDNDDANNNGRLHNNSGSGNIKENYKSNTIDME